MYLPAFQLKIDKRDLTKYTQIRFYLVADTQPAELSSYYRVKKQETNISLKN